MGPRMDHPQMVELEVGKRRLHRSANRGCFIELDLESKTTAVVMKKQIDFRAAVSPPEKNLLWPEALNDLFYGKTFPGGPQPGMTQQGMIVRQAKEAVEQSAVSEVNLRGLDLPLADVLMPRLKLTDHEGACENIPDFEDAANRAETPDRNRSPSCLSRTSAPEWFFRTVLVQAMPISENAAPRFQADRRNVVWGS